MTETKGEFMSIVVSAGFLVNCFYAFYYPEINHICILTTRASLLKKMQSSTYSL
jgi:hypothetical protein